MRMVMVVFAAAVLLATASAQSEQRPVIKEARGYWPLPTAAVQPDKTRDFKVIFDATRAAAKPEDVVPAVGEAAALVNALAATGVPAAQRKMAIIFHGAAVDGILGEESYKEKYGVANPNLKLIHSLREAGVELFVCGQFLHFRQIDPAKVVSDVQLATGAMLVNVSYQNRGYALLPF
jgi:intracellular sulfur oxidation DsrE/DsrF family protein